MQPVRVLDENYLPLGELHLFADTSVLVGELPGDLRGSRVWLVVNGSPQRATLRAERRRIFSFCYGWGNAA